jgi:hypothetical protein
VIALKTNQKKNSSKGNLYPSKSTHPMKCVPGNVHSCSSNPVSSNINARRKKYDAVFIYLEINRGKNERNVTAGIRKRAVPSQKYAYGITSISGLVKSVMRKTITKVISGHAMYFIRLSTNSCFPLSRKCS